MRFSTRVIIGVLSAALVLLGQSWAAIFPLALLFGAILRPDLPALERWPYGLILLLTTTYGIYVVYWSLGIRGVSQPLATATLLLLIVIGVLARLVRDLRSKGLSPRSPNLVVLAGLGALTALYWFTVTQPETLINLHLGGGDHSNHVGFSYSLISHVHRAPFPNPFTLTGYVHAIHFFVSLLSASSIGSFHGPILGLVFRDFAAFDVIVLVALLQISGTCVKGQKLPSIFMTVMAVVPTSIILRSPGLISHFWLSGFSTSFFAVLVLFGVVGTAMSLDNSSGRVRIYLMSTFLLLGVFQPLAFVPLAVLVHEKFSILSSRLAVRALCLTTLLVAPTVGILGIGLVNGKTGTIASTLLLSGATLIPSQFLYWMVIISSLVVGVCVRRIFAPVLVVLAVASLTNGLWLLSIQLGSRGDTVYYVRKMIWIAIAVGLLVASIAVVILMTQLLATVGRIPGLVLCSITVSFSAFVFGVEPISRFSIIDGAWFANRLVDEDTHFVATAIALNPEDLFTSHLANVALTSISAAATEFDRALLGGASPTDLCELSRRLGVVQIYTSEAGVRNLRTLGCGIGNQMLIADSD